MGILFVLVEKNEAPMRYLRKVIPNFENVSNDRNVPKIRVKCLIHINEICLILIMIIILYINSNVNIPYNIR